MDPLPAKRLRKSRDKKLAGVCGGIAEYCGIDPTVVRLLWVLGTIFLSVIVGGIVAYLVCALVFPEPDAPPAS